MRHLRQSLRTLRRSPGFATAAIATLSLGIAANVAVFTIFDAAVLRPLPYRQPERLAVIWDRLTRLGIEEFPALVSNYFDYRERNGVFEDIAAFRYDEMNLEGSDSSAPRRIRALAATPNLFDVLGSAPAVGRAFTEQDGEGVVLLSDTLWRSRFGAWRGIIGRPIRLDNRQFTVAGVMPANFRLTVRSGPAPDVLIPLVVQRGSAGMWANLRLVARLRPGVTLQQAQAQMTTLAAAIDKVRHPYNGPNGEDAGYGVRVVSLREQLLGSYRPAALLLLGGVTIVLLIACANVANLLVVHRLARRREFAIRIALGARRWHLLLELGAEAAALSIAAAVAGVPAAAWAIRALSSLLPSVEDLQLRIDWRALLFVVCVLAATTAVFEMAGGWWIAMRARMDAPGTRVLGGGSHVRKLLVAAEVALSFVLLAGGGLLIGSLWRLSSVNPGFDAHNVLAMQITLPAYKYGKPVQRAAYFAGVLQALRQNREFASVAAVSHLPLGGGGRGGDPFSIEGRPYRFNGAVPQVAAHYSVTAAYFQTMRIPLLAGRSIEERDQAEGPAVAVVNETMARGFWGSVPEALGKRIVMGAPRPGVQWMTIVGVVGDVKNAALRVEPIPQIYRPHTQDASPTMVLLARTRRDPLELALAARRTIETVDKDQPVYGVESLEQQVSGSIATDRFQTVLLGTFAAIALLLASIGIYSVVEHGMRQRVAEIGIRIAVGARPVDIAALVAAQGMAPVLAGMAVGAAAAFALTQLLRSVLFGISPHDPAVFAAIAALLALSAAAACCVPAARALRIDPIDALRFE